MKLRFELTVPNILTLLRFLAIPVLAYLILAGDKYNTMAFILFIAIWLTDILDGYIARHFHQETEFGKLFDPLVDKIFQFTTAVMMYLAGRLPLGVPLFILGKELLMIIGSIVLLRKYKFVVASRWYGKLTTVLFVVAFAILFLLPPDRTDLAIYIFILPLGWSVISYICYGITDFLPFLRKKKGISKP